MARDTADRTRRHLAALGVTALLALGLGAALPGVEGAQGAPRAQAARSARLLEPAPQSAEADRMEREVLQRVNAERQRHGLQPLRHNPRLSAIARGFSRQMAVEDFFDHTSPSGDTLVERAREGGISYRMLAENIFTSTNISEPVPVAVEDWMRSPGHRRNILRPDLIDTGIGVWRVGRTVYITQDFLRPV